MSVQATKWVIAAIEAVKWSRLVDMSSPTAVAEMCEFFEFNVAAVWIQGNPQTYQLALKEGFTPCEPLTQDDLDHAKMHLAVTLSERTPELANAQKADRIRAIIATQLPSAAPKLASAVTGSSLLSASN